MTILMEGQSGLPSSNPTKSYWHQDPSKVLVGHRTTPDLPRTADIVIVGSGMSGSMAAHFLKNGKAKDKNVVMLEAREACWGATGRNGGHCQPLLYNPSSSIARFEMRTYNFLKDFIAERKIPCDWVSLHGCLAYLDDQVWQAAKEAVAQIEDAELAAQIEVVDGDDAEGRARLAALRVPHVSGAMVQQRAASFWPYKFVCYVLEKLMAEFPAAGFNLQTNTPVTALRRVGARGRHGSWLLTTPRGTVAATTVLLCTNGYTSRLLPSFSDLVVPTRGQVGALGPPCGVTFPARLDHSYAFLGPTECGRALARDEYLLQRPATAEGQGGQMIFGGGRDHARNFAVGEWRDDEVEESVASYLRQNLSPPLCLSSDGDGRVMTELVASFEWTGIMGYSRDKHAWVGAVPESLGGGGECGGLWICGGYTGHGMPVAALSARAVVGLMMGDEAVDLPTEFAVTEERVRRVRETTKTVRESYLEPWFRTGAT